ncbi:MAG: integrase arm-type DNA-binding domain-containing protein [Rhodobacteraceae bacterium]|nr:integrase arm-type DNA-binding domain-containing protein [Paracoccaceae bacterium]
MIRNSLSHFKVKSLNAGKYADGQGLWLCKNRKDAGKWVLRLSIHGRRREMGLGRWPDVTIAEARLRADDARRLHRDGFDPIIEREKLKNQNTQLTVAEAINGCFKARQAELKGDGIAGRWLSPLKVHIIPKLGKFPITEVDQLQIKRILEPIWHTKPEAAQKALNRLNLTLKHAAALGLDVDLQATMKARALLGKQRHTVTHIPSLNYENAPEFYKWLKTKSLTSALALRFLILTAARTSEVRLATFEEIDGNVWTLVPERTKTGQLHRIPLTDEALEIVTTAAELSHSKYLFPSPTGKPLSDAAMASFMKREGYTARPHGFRASFRTWVEEQTDTPYEIKESALAHIVGSKTERAYQRSDRLEKRRELMEKWTYFLTEI